MKKTLVFLVLAFAFSGMTFASFHVEKSSEVSNSSSIITANDVTSNVEVIAENNAPVSSGKAIGSDTNTAIILAVVSVVFLPFGLHNWYLGRTKQALWQTLLVFPGFILLGIPALISWIWQIVDLIKLLTNGKL